MPPKTTQTAELEATFAELVQAWHKEADYYSFVDQRVSHWAYRKIIELGEPVLPLILRELEASGGDWRHALEILTGANPLKNEMWGESGAVKKAWLEWAREQGYRW